MKRPYLKTWNHAATHDLESGYRISEGIMALTKEGKMHNTVSAWIARHRYRRDLVRQLELGNHLIEDIGLTREQVLSEITKPFWRA
jgi:uncharacterized protein YjiS (DUF1127 family)